MLHVTVHEIKIHVHRQMHIYRSPVKVSCIDPLFTVIEPNKKWNFSKASKLLFYILTEQVFYIFSLFFTRY